MNQIKQGAAALAFLAASATAALAGTTNGVTNGTFESGNLAGWTSTCPTAASTLSGFLGADDLGIDSGSFYAILNSQDQFVPTCDLYQDVAIPAGASAASLQMRYALTGSNNVIGTSSKRIDITRTDGTILETIQVVTNRSETRAFAPLITPVDLSEYAGQTVRIRARVTNTLYPTVSADIIGLDDVVLTITTPDPVSVPTLSEWAMILFGAVLAGGAALLIQRRRQAA